MSGPDVFRNLSVTSWPGLTRPSTRWRRGVDARDKRGHDGAGVRRARMTDLALAFSPLLPWPRAHRARRSRRRRAGADGGAARQRGAAVRAFAFALLIAALADPSLVREKRDPQKSVVAVVIDKSDSQNFGARTAQTEEARKALELGARQIRRRRNARDQRRQRRFRQ